MEATVFSTPKCTWCDKVTRMLTDVEIEVNKIDITESKENYDLMMADFHSQNLFAAQVFSNAFIFRPWLKGIIYLSVGLILSLLALFFFNGLGKWTESTQLDEN